MRLLRTKQVVEKLGISKAEIYRRRNSDPAFPRPVELSPGIVGFIESEIDTYRATFIARRDRKLIRQED